MFLALLTAYAAHVAAVEPCEYGLELNGRMKYWTVPQETDPYAGGADRVAGGVWRTGWRTGPHLPAGGSRAGPRERGSAEAANSV